jgi:hypothetical protein
VEVYMGGVADGAAAAGCLGFADTEAGTKDIIVVAGFVGVAEGAGFPVLKPGGIGIAPRVLMGVRSLLVPTWCLGDLVVWRLLLAARVGDRAAPTVALMAASESMRIHSLGRRDRRKVLEVASAGGRRVGSDLGTQSGIALWSVILCCLEQR